MSTSPSRLAKLFGAIAFYPLVETWRAMGKLLGKPFSGIAVAIYYHRIPSEHAPGFARQLDHLVRWSEPIRADRSEPLRPGTRSVIVTFDDGWHSFYATALPEISRRRIPVTVFAVAERFGRRLENDVEERLMTADELRSVPPDCVTVGSHTCTHPDLRTLDEQRIRVELRDSRRILEDLTGSEVKLFCFPYGSFNSTAIRLCAEEGYTRVFTGMPGLALQKGDGSVGRISVEPTDWPIEFHLKISGAYCWVPWAIAAKRAIRSRMRTLSSVTRLLSDKRQPAESLKLTQEGESR